MSTREELCSCGQKAVLLGRCLICFGGLSQTFQIDSGSSPEAGSLRPGQRFAGGRFTLIELLGEGGMGTVWLADDEPLSRDGAPVQVALKFIGGGGQADEELIRLLRKEVRAALRLSHPNLVRVHSWHEHRGEPVFYSMEFVAGLDLKRLLEQQSQGRFSCRELQPLLGQLVDALIYAHEQVGLVHRDLKPANILVTPEGKVKLADFGLARPDVAEDVFATTAGGTLCYASPQQRGGAAPTVSDDIYSLGAVLYHLLTGHLPYSIEELAAGETPPPPVHPWRVVGQSGGDRRSVTAEAAGTLLRCLSYDAEERPPDVRTFWKWWNAGPPVEEGRLTGGFLVSAAKGMLGGTFILLLLLLALGTAWRLGLQSTLQRHAPRIAELGRRIEAAIFPPVVIVERPPATPPKPPTTPQQASANASPLSEATILQLELEGTRTAKFELFQSSGGSNSWTPLRSGKLTGTTLVHLATSAPGTYRLEAGQGENRTGTTWTQVDFSLTEGTNRVVVDFRPSRFQLFLNEPIPFHVIDAWGNIVTKFENSFFPFRSPPIPQAPWGAGLPRELKLLAGTYRIVPEKRAAIAQHFEEEGSEFTLTPGEVGAIGVQLVPWRVPRLVSDWTNSLRMHLIPAPDDARFLAATTETTVGQFSVFAQDTKLIASSIESITANGSTNIGRTWQNAVTGQSPDHPVVGISWHEAKAFCDWLTQTERSRGKLTEHQHYELPTSDQWATLVGNNAFPWHGTFPPTADQGNYAGLEVKGPDWPAGWNGLVFDYEDRRSPRTVPVSTYRNSGLGFSDLGGNAAEWCDSWYRTASNAMAKWKVPSKRLADDLGGNVYRVVRGGSWFDHRDEDMLRTNAEWAERPDTRNDRIGFRVVLLEDKETP